MRHRLIIFTALFGALFMLQSCADDEASQTNIAARAYKSASTQTITPHIDTKVILDAEDFDTNSDFADSRFTATVTGYYQVTGQVFYVPTEANKNYQASIFKNGINYSFNYMNTNDIFGESALISDVIYLSAGDYVELYTSHTASSSAVVNNASTSTFISIVKTD